ncbi:helix-turn-helix domain-containing protein [Demequina maris]|uniref:helix-turn-helix domain-containing protein n=1 Tax=Demequina maris TaxID=1638982 RepID=UPI00078645CF|nr:helix-turn-helix transcriptional regulator [Demequina maris]
MTGAWPREVIADPAGEAARLLAIALREEMGDRSASAVARQCGLGDVTVGNVLNGKTWVDLRTLVQLEVGLGVRLWPRLEARRASQ